MKLASISAVALLAATEVHAVPIDKGTVYDLHDLVARKSGLALTFTFARG